MIVETSRTVTMRDGTPLFLREWGPAGTKTLGTHTPILCLCGITRNSKDFQRVGPDLAKRGHRVLALDYRGRGQSGRSAAQTYTPQMYLDDIRNVIAACGLHDLVVIGTSLGGLLAMAMGVAMPSALKGVVINDIGPELVGDGVDHIAGYIGRAPSHPNWDSAIADVKEMLPDLNLDDEGWRQCAEGCFRESEDGTIVADWDPAIAKMISGGGDLPDLWKIFRSLRGVPVLAFRGELSKLLSAETFEKMSAEHSALTQITIGNRGHAPTLDEPESRTALYAYLNALSSR